MKISIKSLTLLLLAAIFILPANAAYQIALDPAAPVVNSPVTATVLKDGIPEPGILVQFVLNGGTPILSTTDSQGKARFTPLIPGTLAIYATTMDGVPLANRSVSVAPAEVPPPGTATYQITLEPAAPVVNNPLDVTVLKNGTPEPGILVQFILNGGTPVLSTTDPQGKARYVPLIPGTLNIIASTMDGVPLANISVPVAPAEVPPPTYQITLEPAAPVVNSPVTATVLKDGTPEPGILVQFILNGGTPIFNTTDPQGKARFIPLVPGVLDIYATTMDGVPLANKSVPVLASQPENGIIAGKVTDSSTGAAIAGATVTAGSVTATTDAAGSYSITIAPGTYTVTVGAAGFLTQSVPNIAVVPAATTTQNFALSPVPAGSGIITGKVTDSSTGAAIAGATVTAGSVTATTDPAGSYSITIAAGTYTVMAGADDYNSESATVTVVSAATVTQNFALTAGEAEEPEPEKHGAGEGGRGSGGSGGGGVTTSEPYENIEKAERHEKGLIANTPVTYDFIAREHGIEQIVVTGNMNENDIALRVEVLKGTAKTVTASPPGIVYKNLNIWAGTKLIKKAIIRFKVDNSWMQSNGIAGIDVKMLKWDGSKWIQLETGETGKDGTYTHFEVATDTFSHFAIIGMKGETTAPAATPEVEITRPEVTPGAIPVSPKTAFPINLAVVTGVFILIAVIVLLSIRRR